MAAREAARPRRRSRDRTPPSGPFGTRLAELPPEFAEVAQKLRSAIRIPGVAHSTLEYQRWAFRSQWRPDGRRFIKAMDVPLTLPVLQLHGMLDPYVMASTVRRCSRYAPDRVLKFVDGAGYYPHQERPEAVTGMLLDFAAAL